RSSAKNNRSRDNDIPRCRSQGSLSRICHALPAGTQYRRKRPGSSDTGDNGSAAYDISGKFDKPSRSENEPAQGSETFRSRSRRRQPTGRRTYNERCHPRRSRSFCRKAKFRRHYSSLFRLIKLYGKFERIFTARSIVSAFSRIFSRRSLSSFGLSARNLLMMPRASSLRWPPMNAPSHPLTKNILRFALWFGNSFNARSKYGRVRSLCRSEFHGPRAASIQLSLMSLLLTKSFQYFALFSGVAMPPRAAYA